MLSIYNVSVTDDQKKRTVLLLAAGYPVPAVAHILYLTEKYIRDWSLTEEYRKLYFEVSRNLPGRRM